MDQREPPVKKVPVKKVPDKKPNGGADADRAKRRYDGSRRQAQAAAARTRIIDAAERLFLDRGYAATTVTAVAAAAGLSADTVYKSFGGKPGLVRAIRDRALLGTGPIPAERRSDALHEQEDDPRRIIEMWGNLSMEIAPRASPILLLVRDAAVSDPEMAALRDQLDADRLVRMTENARRLGRAGHLRPGLSVHEAGELCWTYTSPELYEVLVLRRGWSIERYGRFIADALIGALL